MKITRIWFADDRIYGLTDDGRTLWQSLLYYRRLRTASDSERARYEMGLDGIHWPQLDEDVSFESFEYEQPEPEGMSRFFLSHPEINIAAVARRVGISQSLFAQYVNGIKCPSEARRKEILAVVRGLGVELAAAVF